MRKKRLKYFEVLLLMAILISLTIPLWIRSALSSRYKQFVVSENMAMRFSNLYTINADVNTGLTIQFLSFNKDETTAQGGRFFDMVVLNHSSETISFPNSAYGLRIFAPNEKMQQWDEISPNFNLGNDVTLLESKVESYCPNTNNTFFMPYSAYDINIPENIRICVFGTGQITSKNYAACVDSSRRK